MPFELERCTPNRPESQIMQGSERTAHFTAHPPYLKTPMPRTSTTVDAEADAEIQTSVARLAAPSRSR